MSQLQSLYGDVDEWAVLINPIGYAPPAQSGSLPYLGEPSELLHQLHQYRLRLARTDATADHVRRVLAGELDVPTSVLETYLHSGSMLVLSNVGWMNMVRACQFMRTN